MRKIILFFIIFICICTTIIFFYTSNITEKQITQCVQTNDQNKIEKCYKKLFSSLLLRKLLIYKYNIIPENNKKNDSYLVLDKWTKLNSFYAMEKSDLLISYGIADDILFEDNYSSLFKNKCTYAYDCGVKPDSIKKKNNRFFYPECIGTDKFILTLDGQKSSGIIHTFDKKIKELDLKNKKIFIKMDIAGAEYEVLPDVLKYADKITGLTISFHTYNVLSLLKLQKILDSINKDFILISRNTINLYAYKKNLNTILYNGQLNCDTIILSYINKSLLTNYSISLNQNTDKLYREYYRYDGKKLTFYNKVDKTFDKNDINIIVPITEKIKHLFIK